MTLPAKILYSEEELTRMKIQPKTDVWTEDCSIAMSNMHLVADSLGLGSCWIQERCR